MSRAGGEIVGVSRETSRAPHRGREQSACVPPPAGHLIPANPRTCPHGPGNAPLFPPVLLRGQRSNPVLSHSHGGAEGRRLHSHVFLRPILGRRGEVSAYHETIAAIVSEPT